MYIYDRCRGLKFNLFLDRFYSHNSCFVHGGVEKPGEEQPPVMGQAVRYSNFIFDIHACLRKKRVRVNHHFGFSTQVSHRSGKILKTFSSQGNQRRWGFQPKSGEKIWNQGTIFQNHFQPFKPFNLRRKTFLSGKVLLLGSVSVINWCFCKHYPNGKWRPHLKRINMFFFLTKMSWSKNKKKLRKNLRKSGKFYGIRKVGTLSTGILIGVEKNYFLSAEG